MCGKSIQINVESRMNRTPAGLFVTRKSPYNYLKKPSQSRNLIISKNGNRLTPFFKFLVGREGVLLELQNVHISRDYKNLKFKSLTLSVFNIGYLFRAEVYDSLTR